MEPSLGLTLRETYADGPPPMPLVDADPRRDGSAAVAVALLAATEAHPSTSGEQAAALAGTVLADSMAAGSAPRTLAEAVDLAVEAHRALGSDAEVVSSTDDEAEVRIGQCPYGPGVHAAPALCHVTTGLAGRLAARVDGAATVALERSIAAGDEHCTLRLTLSSEDDGETHRWPPTTGSASGPNPNFDLSLTLPSENSSVPVVRRLAGQALRAFGVRDGDIDDVQLAITEACANVTEHAADTDTYEVRVELAADRCAITVVDQGGGFDAASVPRQAETDAEDGRGISLMRALVDRISFRNEPQAGAVVHLVKQLDFDPDHPLWAGHGVPGQG